MGVGAQPAATSASSSSGSRGVQQQDRQHGIGLGKLCAQGRAEKEGWRAQVGAEGEGWRAQVGAEGEGWRARVGAECIVTCAQLGASLGLACTSSLAAVLAHDDHLEAPYGQRQATLGTQHAERWSPATTHPTSTPKSAEPGLSAMAYITSSSTTTSPNHQPTWIATSAARATSAVGDNCKWSLPLKAVKGTWCSWQIEVTKGKCGRQRESVHAGTHGLDQGGQLVVGYPPQGMERIGTEKGLHQDPWRLLHQRTTIRGRHAR